MILDTIFKRTSTGKVQEWQIEVEGNKFRTITGQQEGKKTTSEWTTCKGKNIGRSNETKPEEQALAEARAKRVLKLAAEYREAETNIDDSAIWKEPMAAYGVHLTEIQWPCWTQPKLDGIRCVMTKDGAFSRYGKQFSTADHILKALKPQFDANPDLEVDGELYNHELRDDFDELSHLIKKKKPKPADLKAAKEQIQFHVFDIREPSLVYQQRLPLVAELVREVDNPCVVMVPTHYVTSPEELDESYDVFLEAGYEGQMLRHNSLYVFKRTFDLLKRKEFLDDEFEIVAVIEGIGNRSNTCGKLVVRLKELTTDGRDTCEVPPKGGFKFYRRLWADRDNLPGKMLHVRFQNYTPKKSLRFPVGHSIRDYE